MQPVRKYIPSISQNPAQVNVHGAAKAPRCTRAIHATAGALIRDKGAVDELFDCSCSSSMMFNAFCLDSKSAAAASCFLLLLMLSSIQLVGGFVAYARRNVGGCKIEKTTTASWIEHIGCRPLDRQVAHKPKLPSKYRATQSSSIRVEERNYPFDSRPLVPKGVWSETTLKANAMSACDFSSP